MLRPENVKMLRKLGRVVSLEADAETLFPQDFPARDPAALADRKSARNPGGIAPCPRPALPGGGGRSIRHVAPYARRSGRGNPEERREVTSEFSVSQARPETAVALKREIVDRARALGFDACRIAAAASPRHGNEFRAWLREGAAGEMDWLARGEDKRCDPQQVLAGARSVIVVAQNYWQGGRQATPAPLPAKSRQDRSLCLGRRLPRSHAPETETAGRISPRTRRHAEMLRGHWADSRARSRRGSRDRVARQEHDADRPKARHLVFPG